MITNSSIIEVAITIALSVLFIHASTWEGMINEWFQIFIDKHVNEFWAKPIYSCPICMTPYYGSIIYSVLTLNNMAPANFLYFIATLTTAAGINTLIAKL